ncbi:hypothetical protein [Streptomyces anulatus]|uniref:hypothetical protein n=1 Tax=Streptomyces anulatus TaxID=1892 RepID=UPI003D9ECF32
MRAQRPDPPEGYHEAISAHRATWTTIRQHTNPDVQAAADRQLRERLREPAEHFADGCQALEELRAKAAAQQRVRGLQGHRVSARHREDRLHVPPAPRSPELDERRIQKFQDTGRGGTHLGIEKPHLPFDGRLHGPFTLTRHAQTLRTLFAKPQ